jgi:hypothetical protein
VILAIDGNGDPLLGSHLDPEYQGPFDVSSGNATHLPRLTSKYRVIIFTTG